MSVVLVVIDKDEEHGGVVALCRRVARRLGERGELLRRLGADLAAARRRLRREHHQRRVLFSFLADVFFEVLLAHFYHPVGAFSSVKKDEIISCP